jgi:rubrerythrin
VVKAQENLWFKPKMKSARGVTVKETGSPQIHEFTFKNKKDAAAWKKLSKATKTKILAKQGIKYSAKPDVKQNLRSGMMAELGAINEYEDMSKSAKDPKIKRIIQNITAEEKIHLGEFENMLLKADPEQKKQLLKSKQEAKRLGIKYSARSIKHSMSPLDYAKMQSEKAARIAEFKKHADASKEAARRLHIANEAQEREIKKLQDLKEKERQDRVALANLRAKPIAANAYKQQMTAVKRNRLMALKFSARKR